MRRGTVHQLALSVGLAAAAFATPAAAEDTSVVAARKEMAHVLGGDSVLLGVLPATEMAGAWSQYRAWFIDQKSTIPQKYRALIGLAVSSQIPCAYCIYADTAEARVFGATDEEIKEAVAMAGMTRQWSTILNGMQVDMAAFRKETDAGVAAMREAMAEAAKTAD
jgi:AhpD family alkylhydroperoxidase